MSESGLDLKIEEISSQDSKKQHTGSTAVWMPTTMALETPDNQRTNDSIEVIKALVNKFSDMAEYAAKNVTDAKALAKKVELDMGGGSSHRKKRKTKRKGRKKRKTKGKGRKKRKSKKGTKKRKNK